MNNNNKKQNIFEWDFEETQEIDYYFRLFEIMIEDYNYIKCVDYDDEKLHLLFEKLSLFNIVFYQFERYVKEHDSLSSIDEYEIKRVDKRVIEYLSISLKTLRMALATANCSFAMRITEGIYRTLILAIALNIKDDDGKYILLKTYLDEKYLFDFSDESNEDYIKRISYNSESIVSFELLNFKKKNLFNDDLSWTYPLFKILDSENLLCNIRNPEDKYKITLDDISRVLVMNSYDIIPCTSEAFNTYSSFEHYFDAKNPVIPPFDFAEDKKYSFFFNFSRFSIGNVFSSVLYMTSMIVEFLYSIEINEKLSKKFNDISFQITESLYNLDSKVDDIKNPKKTLMNEPFAATNMNEVRNNDDMFAKILNGMVDVSSDKDKEAINEYFVTYRDKFLVSNEVYGVEHVFVSNQISSESIALKYMNCFRSLLNGLRFSKYERYPSKSKYDKKKVFPDNNKIFKKASNQIFKSKYEDLSFENIITSYQLLANVCNSVIIGDKDNALIEAKHLYETIGLKTALFRWDMENFFDEKDIEKVSSYLRYQEANMQNGLTSLLKCEFAKFIEKDEVFNDIPFDKVTENKYKTKFAKDSGFETFPVMDNFKFTKINSINSYETLFKYLSDKKEMNIVLSQFDRMYKQHNKLSMPFFDDDDIKDQDLILLILELAEILVQTTLFDTIVMFLKDDNIDIVIDTVLYMIKSDLAMIEINSTSIYGISNVDFNF